MAKQIIVQGYFTYDKRVLLVLKPNGSLRLWAPIGGHIYRGDGSEGSAKNQKPILTPQIAIEKRLDTLVGKEHYKFHTFFSNDKSAIVEYYVDASSRGNEHHNVVFYGTLIKKPVVIEGQVNIFNLQDLEKLRTKDYVSESTLERSVRAINQIRDLAANVKK